MSWFVALACFDKSDSIVSLAYYIVIRHRYGQLRLHEQIETRSLYYVPLLFPNMQKNSFNLVVSILLCTPRKQAAMPSCRRD